MSQSNRGKGFITTYDEPVIDMFQSWGYTMTTNMHQLAQCHFVVFPGGEDISPFMYGQRRITQSGPFNFRRDMRENRVFRNLLPEMPKLGICRGAQFLNIMNGGSLYQHVDNHAVREGHMVKLFFDSKFEPIEGESSILVTSTHHQLMVPALVNEALVLGMANQSKELKDDSMVTKVGINDKRFREAEIVYYPLTNSLCYQPHPEYVKTDTHPCRGYFKDAFETMMDKAYGAKQE